LQAGAMSGPHDVRHVSPASRRCRRPRVRGRTAPSATRKPAARFSRACSWSAAL